MAANTITNAAIPLARQPLEQVAAFLGALHDSNVMRQALILCPATVLSHWMAELHAWAPKLRVVILHRCVQAFNAASGSSGTGETLGFLPWHSRSLLSFGWFRQGLNDTSRGLASQAVDTHPRPAQLSINLCRCGLTLTGKLRALIRRILSWPGVVLVTSYEGMKALNALLLPCNWDYCILDEGQRIRNPDAKVT